MSVNSTSNNTPITALALPLPTGAAQDGADISAPTAMPAGGSGIRGWLSAIWTKLNGSLAVTGAFFQATQPVSIAATVPVSGTFFQATQPVSGTVTLGAGAAAVGSVSVSNFPATQNTDVTDRAARLLGVIASITNAVSVVQATLTKGTQGATGVTTQDLKDSGRSARTITLDSFAIAATAETLMTMSYSTDNGTLTTGASYTVTAGKRLRIQVFSAGLHTIAGNTTAVNVIVRVRVNNAGAATIASPVQLVVPIQGVAAANQAGMPVLLDFPDGWEFVAGAGIAVTVACAGFVATTAAPKADITITAYEY